MKAKAVKAIIAGFVIVEIVAATAAVAGARNLPPQCSTRLIVLCGDSLRGSIQCLRRELAKVERFCRRSLLDGALPATLRSD